MLRFRPRLTFSLRTLFVLVTLVGGWLSYHVRWINQRHDARQRTISMKMYGTETRHMPIGLRLLGEEGVSWMIPCDEMSAPDQTKLRTLFPEATVYVREGQALKLP